MSHSLFQLRNIFSLSVTFLVTNRLSWKLLKFRNQSTPMLDLLLLHLDHLFTNQSFPLLLITWVDAYHLLGQIIIEVTVPLHYMTILYAHVCTHHVIWRRFGKSSIFRYTHTMIALRCEKCVELLLLLLVMNDLGSSLDHAVMVLRPFGCLKLLVSIWLKRGRCLDRDSLLLVVLGVEDCEGALGLLVRLEENMLNLCSLVSSLSIVSSSMRLHIQVVTWNLNVLW